MQVTNVKTTNNSNFHTRQHVLQGAFIQQIAATGLISARAASRTSLLTEKCDYHELPFRGISCLRLFLKSVDTYRF
jgi:hypothetical protein